MPHIRRLMLFGLAAALTSGLAVAQSITLVSGNGQLTCPSCTINPSAQFDPLVVEVRNAAGQPVPNAEVRWAIANTTAVGVLPTLGSELTYTDANGRTQNTFFQPGVFGQAFSSFIQTTVSATVTASGASVAFTETTAIPNIQGTPAGIVPVVSRLVSPPAGSTITGRVGEQGDQPIQVQVAVDTTVSGITVTQGIPNVAVQVEKTAETTADTTVACAPQAGAAPGPVFTDINGFATCYLVFGNRPGTGTVVARVGGNFARTNPIQFNATVGAPRVIRIIRGDQQSGNAGTTLPTPLLARVEDAGGNVLPNVPVQWSVISGNMTLIGARTVSDSGGLVQTQVQLGSSAGAGQIRVSAVENPAVTATFTVTTIFNVTGLNKVSGDNQVAAQNAAFPEQLAVQAVNLGQPLANIPVTFSVTSGSANLTSTTVNTDNQGIARVGVTAGSTFGTVTVTATAGGQSQTFTLIVRQPGPSLQSSSFINAASRQRGPEALSPCGVAQIEAPGIAPGIQGVVEPSNALFGPLPLQLAGVTIQFGNSFAPIYGVSNVAGRETVTFQVPCEVVPGNVQVTVRVGSGSATVVVPVQAVSPGIIETVMTDGRARAVLLKPDGTFVSLENPARRGEIIRMFVTGIGRGRPELGSNQPGIPNIDIAAVNPVIVGVNHEGVRVVSAILARNLIGFWEVAFEVPSTTPAGNNIPLAVAVGQGDRIVFGNGSALPVQ